MKITHTWDVQVMLSYVVHNAALQSLVKCEYWFHTDTQGVHEIRKCLQDAYRMSTKTLSSFLISISKAAPKRQQLSLEQH